MNAPSPRSRPAGAFWTCLLGGILLCTTVRATPPSTGPHGIDYVGATSTYFYEYGWTISGSDTDPFVNSGSPAGGPTTLYLWLQCTTKDGAASAVFDLSVIGAGSSIEAFIPTGHIINAGDATQLLLAFPGCPGDGDPALPFLVGSIQAFDAGAEYCIVPSAEYNWNATVDCSPYQEIHPNFTKGYSSLGGPPPCDDSLFLWGLCPGQELWGACCHADGSCRIQDMHTCLGEKYVETGCGGVDCTSTPVESMSWGRIKTVYR